MSGFPSKLSIAKCLAAFLIAPRLCAAGPKPILEWDPDTISPCIMWEDNGGSLTCQQTRTFWNITAEEFSAWNPSVALDCKPWNYQSYCVVPQVRLPISTETSTTAEPSTTTATTTTSSTQTQTLGPSPTSWSYLDCYVDEDVNLPVLEKRVSGEGGNTSLMIPNCQLACYQAFLTYAGVKAGNECWCGGYVAGELAKDATAECNIPCTDDSKIMCGGKDRLDIFEPIGFAEAVDGAVKANIFAEDA